MILRTLSLMLRYFGGDPSATPPYVYAFINWFATAHGRVATDDGGITIEASPNPGRVYVAGIATDNNLDRFFAVLADPTKKAFEVLSIAGGTDDFDRFAHAVAGADNDWDINFQTLIKYLVARYNHYATTYDQPRVPHRHSYLESDGAEYQRLYEMVPFQFNGNISIGYKVHGVARHIPDRHGDQCIP